MYTIMLVEDETTVREGIVQKIDWQAHGFALVCACENGQQAVAVLEQQPVDVIITDINMPGMDGLALAAHVSRTAPNTIVVILTGFGDFSYAQTAISHRVHEYILKPVTARQLRELLDRLRTELDKRRAHNEGIVALREEVEQAYALMRERFLADLCTAAMPAEEAAARAAELSLRLAGAQFCAVLLDPVQPSAPARADLLAAVGALADKQSAEVFSGEGGRMVLLLGADDAQHAARALLRGLLRQRKQSFFCCIGDAVPALGLVHESYARAVLAWEHLYRLGADNLVLAQEALAAPQKGTDTGHLRRTILRHVRLCSPQSAMETLDELFTALKSAGLAREGCVYHLQKLAVMLDEYREEADLPIPEDAAPTLFAAQPTLEAAQESLRRSLRALLEASRTRGHSGDRQAALAVDFIKEHYTDPSLSLQTLTEHLSVSTSHFSSIFKSYTGVTFVEFLTRLRMNKAQDLLVSTDMRNYEIADAVGFDDPGYFSSAFKKHTGMKPSDYRKRYRNPFPGGEE